MTSKKKQWKKAIDQGELLKDLEDFNTQKAKQQSLSSLKDSDLFTVATKKVGVRQEREKLKRDRFREKQKNYTSITEETLLKKHLQKLENKQAHPPKPKKKEDDEDEMDIWNDEAPKAPVKPQSFREKSSFVAIETTPIQQGKVFDRFRNFKAKSQVKTKAVVVPLGGQSYNPSAKDHKKVIEQVVEREKEEVKEQERILRHLKPYLFKEQDQAKAATVSAETQKSKAKVTIDQQSDQEEEDNSDDEGLEITNEAVDRDKRLTKQQKTQKIIKKAIQQEKLKIREKQKFDKSFDRLKQYENEDENIRRRTEKNIKRRLREQQ